ncbi:STP1 protein [Plasmodium ovale wallikeri]|uniref:STP1 protein n=1 Tax=Plasmodium ovale wallikeri TaxID=864142 RepID=A0A1A9ALL6_PLAOA|nr:STP1 protein [Plasmodium ovale wallikeri]
MAGDSGYSIYTRDIPIDVFLDYIQGDIKNLIRTHGHKNCGLRHKEVCEQIRKIITTKKALILGLMDSHGQQKLNSEWESQKKEFINKLYQEEGFINTCFPKTYKNDLSLNQLISKHIDFCKQKDVKRKTVEKNLEYNACKEYDSWIETEKKSFTLEYLKNVKDFTGKTVHKYFSTKEHPKGYDPQETYRNSKLDCTKYNSPPRSDPKIAVAKAPTIILHSPAPPDLDQKSQGKRGKSIPGGDGRTEKEKSDVNIPPKPEPPASDSLASSQTKIKVDRTDNSQNPDLKAKGTDLPSKDQGDKGQPSEATGAKTQSPQKLPEPPSSISHQDSLATHVPETLPSVIKGQDTVSDSTPRTTSAASGTTYSTENVQSPLAPDLSLAQLQPTTVAAVTDQYSNEPTPSGPVGKSPNKDAPLTSTLDPGLAPSQAAASNSIASETSSSTMTLTPDSSLGQDSHLPTPTQSIVINNIDKTLSQTTSVAGPPTITVSAMGTSQIPSIIEIKSKTVGSGEPNELPNTIAGSQGPNIASPKKEDNALSPNSGSNFPDTTSSPKSANSNVILLPGPPPGLPSSVSLGGSVPVLPDPHVVSSKPDGKETITLFKITPKKSKDLTLVSSTSLPEGAQPSGEPSVTSTKFPPLTTIIPTIIITLAAITLLFQLYKYTPFGLLLGRRRKRKKRDLKRIFKTPEKPTYEYPNITVHELEDPNLLGQIVENDAYIKLLKINRYKQEMQKRKKKNKKTLIEVHMEVLEEHKKDEWELHKGDFLEICLRGFINEENETYQNFPNSKLTINNINEKTIEDIQKQEILWNNWIEDHRNILEQWKKEEWFHILKNKWKKEQQIYKANNNKLQENILNEEEKHSIVSQKDIWKQWILKQATLIDMFNKEDWFKSMVYVQDKEKNNCRINEYNNITVTTETQLKNEKPNHEYSRSKGIIQKLMVQIHMMVLEECIKEDIIKQKELSIDNFIEDIHNQNNYDEKRNMPQSDIDNFKVPEFEEIHTSTNK